MVSLLPSGYQQVEYITFTGTQFIRSGITSLTAPYDVETFFNKTNNETSDQCLFGQRQLGKFSNMYNTYFENSPFDNSSSGSVPTNRIANLRATNNGVILDGITLVSGSNSSCSSSYEGLIGAFSEDSYANAKWFFKGKIYGMKITSNGTLIRNYIPARNSSNQYGLYDVVNNAWYTNSGSGSLTGGNDVGINLFPLPSDYQKCTYIQTNGNQWINTGVIGQAKWVYDIQYTDLTTRQLMGHGGAGGEYWGVTDGKYGKASWSTSTIPIGNRDIFQVNNFSGTTTAGTGGYIYINGTLAYNNTYDSRSENAQAQLFAINGNYKASCKLWGCQVYNTSNTLIRNFIPCFRKSDGVVGMYDAVNKLFYTNSGSGSFGYEIDTSIRFDSVNYKGTNIDYFKKGVQEVWFKNYKLTISTSGTENLSSYGVSRTSSQKAKANTGNLTSGSDIFKDDVLSATATPKTSSTSYSSWSPSSISTPTLSANVGTVTITNPNSYSVTAYYGTSSGATTYSKSVGANTNASVTVSTYGNWYFFLRTTQSRTKTTTTYSGSATYTSGSSTVGGNVAVSIVGGSSSSQTSESQNLNSSVSSVNIQLTQSIVLQKNSNVSSISLTYTNASGTSTTVTSVGTYTAKIGTSYSWSASASTGYNISSDSGSGTVGNNTITISPTASVKTYRLTLSNNDSYTGTTAQRTSSPYGGGTTGSISNGATLYYGDVITITMKTNSPSSTKLSLYQVTMANVTQSVTTKYMYYDRSAGSWKETSTNYTGCIYSATCTINGVNGNVWSQTATNNKSWQSVSLTGFSTSKINSGSTTYTISNSNIANQSYFPYDHIYISAGTLYLQSSGTNTRLTSMYLNSYSSGQKSLKYGGITGKATVSISNCVLTLQVNSKAGAYKFWFSGDGGAYIYK